LFEFELSDAEEDFSSGVVWADCEPAVGLFLEVLPTGLGGEEFELFELDCCLMFALVVKPEGEGYEGGGGEGEDCGGLEPKSLW
jgi:hypothetical protein